MRVDTAKQLDPADVAGFAAAREICRRAAPGLFFAAAFLPPTKRHAAYAVCAFCRMIHEAFDAADDDVEGGRGMRSHPAVVSPAAACCGPSGSLEVRLARFRDRLDDIYDGRMELPAVDSRSGPQHALHAFAGTVRRYGIPRQHFLDLAEGRRMDLTVARYATWKSLERYCYHAAGAVGPVLCGVFGVTHSGAGECAAKIATAMRLTDILRDLKDDRARGRVYLPQADLARFRYSERDLAAGVVNDNFRELMRFEVERARGLFYEGAEGLCWLADDGSRLAASALAVQYAGLLRAIEGLGYDVFGRRAEMTAGRKLQGVAGAWRLARRREGRAVPRVF